MKILAYTNLNPLVHRGGAERFYRKFLERLVQEGNEVVSVHEMESSLWKSEERNGVVYENRNFRTLEDKVRNSDLVIAQLKQCDAVIDFAHRYNKRVVYLVHNDYFKIKLMAGMLNRNDFIIYNTNWIRKTVPSYASPFVIHPMLDVKDVRKRGRYITFVNPIARKGANLFYEIAKSLPDRQFLVVEGGYGKQDKRPMENITFLPATDDMFSDVYAKTKLLLVPSEYDSYGMVCAEAGYCGVPVICSDLIGFRECLGEYGEYVKGGVNNWVKAIEKFDDKALYKERSGQLKEFIRNKLEEDEFENFYKALLKKI